MTATVFQARDEILSLFKAAWDAGAESAGVLVLYADSKADIPTGMDADNNPLPWARVTVQHIGSLQGSLAGSHGTRRWTRNGIVTVQIFTAFGTGLSLSDKLAMIALGAFEGKETASHVWFRNVRPEEIGQDGVWFQTNVIAEFTYDEVR